MRHRLAPSPSLCRAMEEVQQEAEGSPKIIVAVGDVASRTELVTQAPRWAAGHEHQFQGTDKRPIVPGQPGERPLGSTHILRGRIDQRQAKRRIQIAQGMHQRMVPVFPLVRQRSGVVSSGGLLSGFHSNGRVGLSPRSRDSNISAGLVRRPGHPMDHKVRRRHSIRAGRFFAVFLAVVDRQVNRLRIDRDVGIRGRHPSLVWGRPVAAAEPRGTGGCVPVIRS